MSKNEALDLAIKEIEYKGYIMTPDEELLLLLEELENDGLLLMADRAGDRNPVGDFNPSYTFIER